MKYKDATKKTIIWETNSEPPKSYIWVKPDGKAYEWIDGEWIISPTVVMADMVSAKNITKNGSYPSEPGTAFDPVTVNIPLTTLEVTENGTYTAPNNGGYSKVIVNVPEETEETEE